MQKVSQMFWNFAIYKIGISQHPKYKVPCMAQGTAKVIICQDRQVLKFSQLPQIQNSYMMRLHSPNKQVNK